MEDSPNLQYYDASEEQKDSSNTSELPRKRASRSTLERVRLFKRSRFLKVMKNQFNLPKEGQKCVIGKKAWIMMAKDISGSGKADVEDYSRALDFFPAWRRFRLQQADLSSNLQLQPSKRKKKH